MTPMKRRSAGLHMVLLLATSFLTTDAALASDIDTPFKKLFSGIASWYGGKFHGRRTASGSRYDMHELTCAHKTLPFGTRLIVENPTNGRTCQVTVTDRGPYHGKRVIDLSKAAADKLGLDGVGQVVCYLGKMVGKGLGGTAKETGETIANLPSNLGKVAKGIGEKARSPLSREKDVVIAGKPLSRSAYRKQIERYYKARELACYAGDYSHFEPKGTYEARARNGCLLVPDSGTRDRTQERRSILAGLEEQPM